MDYIRLEWAPEAVRQLECCIKWLYTLYLIVKVLFHIHGTYTYKLKFNGILV